MQPWIVSLPSDYHLAPFLQVEHLQMRITCEAYGTYVHGDGDHDDDDGDDHDGHLRRYFTEGADDAEE